MKELQYNDVIKLMSNYASLPKLEREVIELLEKQECETGTASFCGGYTAISIALNRPKSDVSNVRKAVLSLIDKHIVFYWDKWLCLSDEWLIWI